MVSKILRFCLLFFVCASITVLAVQTLTRPKIAVVSETDLGPDRVIVYTSHAKVRCPTCTKIEVLTKKILAERFGEELVDRKIEWRPLDYEAPENAAFVERHRIATATVLLVRIENGKETESRNFTVDAWSLLDDEEKFTEFFRLSIDRFLVK